MWNYLKKAKVGRCICLTTHFMDEADLLNDRVVIMSAGKSRCAGSSLFLKSKFGKGYLLIISFKTNRFGESNSTETQNDDEQITGENHHLLRRASSHHSEMNSRTERITNVIMSHIPSARQLSTAAAECSYQLPLSELPKFSELFADLESKTDELNIAGFGISNTTLEEVFITVATEGEKRDEETTKSPNDEKAKLSKTLNITESEISPDGKNIGLTNASSKNKAPPFYIQSSQLLIKRWHCAKRDIKGRIFEVLLPVIVIALVCESICSLCVM